MPSYHAVAKCRHCCCSAQSMLHQHHALMTLYCRLCAAVCAVVTGVSSESGSTPSADELADKMRDTVVSHH